MKRSDLLLILVFAVWVLGLSCFPLDNNDTWWHLTGGRLLVETWDFPTVDPFSFSEEARPWINEYWLFQLLLYGLWKAGGFWLLTLLKALGIALAATLAVIGLRRSQQVPVVLSILVSIPVLFLLSERMLLRPGLFSWLWLLVFLMVLPRGRQPITKGRILLLAVIEVLWVNTHPAFLLGPVLAGLATLGQAVSLLVGEKDPRRRGLGRLLRIHAIFGAILLAATLLNPYGIRPHLLAFQLTSTEGFTRIVTEWKPFWADPPARFVWMMVPLALLGLAGVIRNGARRIDPVLLLWMIPFAALAISARRHMAIAALIWGFAAAVLWREYARRLLEKADVRRWATPIVIGSILGLAFLTWSGWIHHWTDSYRRVGLDVQPRREAEKTADWLSEHPATERVLNEYELGGYLLWRLFPERKIWIDGRLILYGGHFVEANHAVALGAPGWDRYLDKHQIDAVAVSTEAWGLFSVLFEHADWRLRAIDPRAGIFTRIEPDADPAIDPGEAGEILASRIEELPLLPDRPWWRAPETPLGYWSLSKVSLLAKRPDLTMSVLSRIADPRVRSSAGAGRYESTSCRLLANKAVDEERWSDVDSWASRGLAWVEDDSDLHVTRAMARVHLNRSPEAEAELRGVVERDPLHIRAWNNLGVLYARSGREEEAREAFRRVLAIDPEEPSARSNLNKMRRR